ncbi:hypothetical protein ACIQGZ_28395 [Streptomyces sp. NPDC092296]|uniref:hypothetical protein n=1 Tax=Streptomyces sp. NPDC092296 TaxID=3366012 RepID=UPI00381F3C20
MPASPLLRRAGTLAAGLAMLQFTALTAAHRALADPSTPPSASPTPSAGPTCVALPGPGSDICHGGSGVPGGDTLNSVTDPLGSLAQGCAQAAAWVLRQLSTGIDSTTEVDFTNTAFLRQYAVVFAASTVLTLVLWLLAVAKRAVRGAPLQQAFSEAVGFLWLTVLASAFTPLILYTVVSATDGVTKAIALGTKSDTGTYLGGFADTLEKGDLGGGPLILIIVSLVAVLAAAVLWLELLIRAAMLYVGALLGTAVYAGLVDRKLWQHVRRWAGLMIAVDLAKPVIVIVLGLAGAIATDAGASDSFARVLSGLSILFLSIFASATIYRFVPGFGDDMIAMRRARSSAVSAGSAVVNGPANFVKQGISTHGSRAGSGDSGPGRASGGGSAPGGSVGSGIAAHSTRTAAAPPAQSPPPASSANRNSSNPKGV